MATLNLLSKRITLSQALDDEKNVLHALNYPKQKDAFYERLEQRRHLLKRTVAQHLGVGSHACQVSAQHDWIHGSFNVCVPVSITGRSSPRQVMLRFPLPFRIGEAHFRGNADEKLRCEAGAYAWLQENCPTVPIPHLYGFGLSTGERFTALHHLPWYSRYPRRAYQIIMSWFGCVPPLYIRQGSNNLDIGYLVIEHIGSSRCKMLSQTWKTRDNEQSRKNLYRGLSRIMLSVSRIPLPRIGAFRLDDCGRLRLDNRPLSYDFVTLENEGIALEIPRSMTYSRVDSYILDVMSTHDLRLIHQPNAVRDEDDAYAQAALLAAAKIAFPRILQRDLRNGPFAFNFTDLHQSNIFVDDDWNVVKIIDLEFCYSCPLQFQQPPYWLSGQGVDEIDKVQYAKHHAAFTNVLEDEEARDGGDHTLSSLIRKSWTSGAFWVNLAVTSPTGFTTLFYDQILPHLGLSTDTDLDPAVFECLVALWQSNSSDILRKKIDDLNDYKREVRAAFRVVSE